MEEIEKIKDSHQRFIRKFTTCDLLEYFSKKSLESYKENAKGYTIVDLPYSSKKNGYTRILKNFMYGQWELIQICYDSIQYSNDYRGVKVDESAFYSIINENKAYTEEIEKIKKIPESKLFEYIQCLTNIQFDFQALNVINKFNRMYQIMVNINKNPNYCQTQEVCYIDFDKKFEDITGMKYSRLINIYFFLVLISIAKMSTNIYDIINDKSIKIEKLGIKKEDIIKVIEIQSKEYSFYKKSNNWNILRFYPIVKTDKNENEYIISNIYSLLLSLPDVMYWTIRNYYKEINSRDFTSYFGRCFEYYLEEVLNNYNISYEKLKESTQQRVKTPDWKIETEKFIFLVEQKSSLFPIDTRVVNEKENCKKIEEYIEKNIIKAFKQLDSYRIENTNKKIIRICLMFEQIYMQENIKYIVEKKMEFTSNKNLNWILNINEFENLMEILNKNESEFNKIIQKK